MKKKSVNEPVKKSKKPVRVMVAIPTSGEIIQDVAVQLIDMMAQSFITKKWILDIRFSKVTCIDYNRNTITRMFLESNNDYLLMMDYDNPCLKNPLELTDWKKDIVIFPTLMFKTDDNGNPVLNFNVFMKEGKAWRTQRMTPGVKRQQYDAGGTGCILIKRKVLENIKAPFLSKLKPDGTRSVGMDLWFCKRAKDKGFQIWVDWDYTCKHMKRVDLLDVARLMIGMLPPKQAVKPTLKLINKK